MQLEDDINKTNKYYLVSDIANIHKKPTPIQIVRVDYPARDKAKIIEAYFKVPSTTDYNGVYRGKAIDFEAKETTSITSFPLTNIHLHQIEHLQKVKQHGGIAFLIVRFTRLNKTFLLTIEALSDFLEHSTKKSIELAYFEEKGFLLEEKYNPRIDYLSIIRTIYLKEN